MPNQPRPDNRHRIGPGTFVCPDCGQQIAFLVATDVPAHFYHTATGLESCNDAE